jgi:hypothetical protein
MYKDKIKSVSYQRVLLKGLVLFLLVNLVFAAAPPLDRLGRISAYNHLFPGRQRLPYGDRPDRAYNLSLYNLEAMFASHVIVATPRPAGEYRVILIGDSSTWGFLLRPEDTLSANLNRLDLRAPDGRRLRFYNLGYPVMSLTKDALLLSYAMRYEPDLIIWPLTLESFPYDKQLFPPLLQNNPEPVASLIRTHHLNLDPSDPALHRPGWWERTLIGSRRALADWFRLQLYGVMWAATGVDQDIPNDYTPRQEDLPANDEFHGLRPLLAASDLGLDILAAGHTIAGGTPVLLINEPMAISHGANSDIRYNFFYPRWAYDDYRRILQAAAEQNGWRYLDAWDLVPGDEFTNSAVHLSPQGSQQFAQFVGQAVQQLLTQP